jgi:hypothetical protein
MHLQALFYCFLTELHALLYHYKKTFIYKQNLKSLIGGFIPQKVIGGKIRHKVTQNRQ